jgi:hypothetical protein
LGVYEKTGILPVIIIRVVRIISMEPKPVAELESAMEPVIIEPIMGPVAGSAVRSSRPGLGFVGRRGKLRGPSRLGGPGFMAIRPGLGLVGLIGKLRGPSRLGGPLIAPVFPVISGIPAIIVPIPVISAAAAIPGRGDF